MIGKPEIISRGFIYMPEAEEMFEAARAQIATVAARPTANLREKVEQTLSDFFYSELKRHPMVFALVNPRRLPGLMAGQACLRAFHRSV